MKQPAAGPTRDNREMKMRGEAERYCALIENALSFDREPFAVALIESLARLVVAATELPVVEPSLDDVAVDISQDEWNQRFSAIQQTLGDWSYYWTTLNVSYAHDGPDEAPAPLPVGDDLADVWRDLKEGLLALEAGADPVDVTYDWRFGFYTHWGRHATEALRALHVRIAETGGRLDDVGTR